MSVWQPIETAPKDGTWALVWNGFRRHIACFDRVENGWVSSFRTVTKRLVILPEPTHWMLPADPPERLPSGAGGTVGPGSSAGEVKEDAPRKIRCGDHVLHRPTGESWVVAYADYETGRLAWAGYPDGTAAIADCELTKAACDGEHKLAVAEWAAFGNEGDHRRSAVLRLYGTALYVPATPAEPSDG